MSEETPRKTSHYKDNIIFYHSTGSPNSWRVHIYLEEKGLPYTIKHVDLANGEQKSAEYLKVHYL
jgi:GST-like protein